MESSSRMRSGWKRAGSAAVLTGLFCVLGVAPAAFAASVRLDENEEIQWVMGDLSALKTAAHTYYSENGQNRNAPSLSEILRYFDENTLPPNAASLYAIRSGVAGWYVGYRAAGLKDETRGLLSENAGALELVCDDLRSPWRRGSAYIWSLALPLGAPGVLVEAPGVTIRGGGSDDDAVSAAAVMIGTAVLLNIIDDHRHGGYTYHYPRGPWYWRSPLTYRHPYRDRFFGRSGRHRRPLPLPPRPRRRPVLHPGGPRPGEAFAPRHEGPSGREHDVRRPGPRLRPQPKPKQKPPAFRPGNGKRPESLRDGPRLKNPRPKGPRPGGPRPEERPRPGRVRPGEFKAGKRHAPPPPRREAPRRRDEELRREGGRGGPRR